MQAVICGIVVRPDNQETTRRHGGLLGMVGRDPPLPGIVKVVRQIVSADVHGSIGRIVDLDPIIGLALRVLKRLAIGGHQLIDPQVRQHLRLPLLRDTDDQQGKKPNSTVSTEMYHPIFLSYTGLALYRTRSFYYNKMT
jgi:hypothetical protein